MCLIRLLESALTDIMIHHCVWVRFRPEIEAVQRRVLFSEIEALVGRLPGLREVRVGRNARFEDMDHGFDEGFIAVFDDLRALRTYQEDPAHRATGQRIVAAAQGGTQGLMVFDMDRP